MILTVGSSRSRQHWATNNNDHDYFKRHLLLEMNEYNNDDISHGAHAAHGIKDKWCIYGF